MAHSVFLNILNTLKAHGVNNFFADVDDRNYALQAAASGATKTKAQLMMSVGATTFTENFYFSVVAPKILRIPRDFLAILKSRYADSNYTFILAKQNIFYSMKKYIFPFAYPSFEEVCRGSRDVELLRVAKSVDVGTLHGIMCNYPYPRLAEFEHVIELMLTCHLLGVDARGWVGTVIKRMGELFCTVYLLNDLTTIMDKLGISEVLSQPKVDFSKTMKHVSQELLRALVQYHNIIMRMYKILYPYVHRMVWYMGRRYAKKGRVPVGTFVSYIPGADPVIKLTTLQNMSNTAVSELPSWLVRSAFIIKVSRATPGYGYSYKHFHTIR